MTDHDLLCPMHPGWHEGWNGSETCTCDLIRVVRADERERIAQAIEAAVPFMGKADAARAARDGGQ